LAVDADESETAVCIVVAGTRSPAATASVLAGSSATAQFAGGAGAAILAAKTAGVDTPYRSADFATALTVGGAGAAIR
jgi:hypothetical protein